MSTEQTEICINFRLPVIIKKRKNWYLSSCPVLDVHSQGKTDAEALANLKEALALFVMTCLKMGTLDKVMKDSGFIGGKVKKRPPRHISDFIDIPITIPWGQQPELMKCRA